MRNSSARRGAHRYSADWPHRQAYCANAPASHDLPEPAGPVIRIAVLLFIKMIARVRQNRRERPRPTLDSVAPGQARDLGLGLRSLCLQSFDL